MRLKYNLLFLFLPLLFSCTNNSEEPSVVAKGYLRNNLPTTKAAPNTDDFIVTIRRANDEFIYSAPYSTYPDLYELEIGSYYADAIFPKDETYKKAAFDQPRYWGKSSMFTITENNVTECNPITCVLQNMKVTVAFSDKITENFKTYSVVVSVTDKDKLTFDKSTIDKEAWYEPLPLTVVFTGYNSEFDETYNQTFKITTDIAKGTYHNIVIGGTHTITKSVDGDVIVHNLELTK